MSRKATSSQTGRVTCPTSGFHDFNHWLEVKPHAPMPADLLKAVHLSEGLGTPVVIASGAPWFDTTYTMLVNDDLYENADPTFLVNDNIVNAYHAARRARFEFGETPGVPGLFERMIA